MVQGDFVETQDQDNVFYNDCTPEQKAYKSELKPHSYKWVTFALLLWRDLSNVHFLLQYL